jgi:hypothetical protein
MSSDYTPWQVQKTSDNFEDEDTDFGLMLPFQQASILYMPNSRLFG